MNGWAVPKRSLMGAVYGVGLGFLAGGMELVQLAASQSLALGMVPFLLLGLVGVLTMGAVGFGLGLVTAPLQMVFNRARPSTALAVHLTLIGFLLCGYYLWQAAFLIYTDERAPAAFAMAAMPLGFTGVVYFNARFLLRRFEIGKPVGTPWLPTSFAAGMSLVALSSLFQGFRDTGGPHALQDDRNIVFVTVDGWDAPSAELESRFADHVVFDNAVTPSPHARPAAAALLTGLHPLRNRTLFDDSLLPWNYTSLAEVLAGEGYATAAFVSQDVLRAESGLEQGFRVYDDDFSPVLAGLLRLNAYGNALGGRGWHRPADATADRFAAWVEEKSAFPFFAWVEVPADGADPALHAILDALEPVADETLVVLTATHGPATRDDGVLYDDRIRVPMLMRMPGLERKNRRIPQQVRLTDLAMTATTWLGVKAPENEGLDLAGFPAGTRGQTIGTSLLGRRPDGRVQQGLRNNGVKVITTVDDEDAGELYRLDDDPQEASNVIGSQREAFDQAQRILGADSIRLEKLTR